MNNKNFQLIKDSVVNINNYKFKNFDIFIHLANVANDPAGDLDSKITWEINVLHSKLLIEFAIKNNFKKFIFASSGSVYGVKKERKVHEDLDLVPISDYNKTKMISERVLLSYKDKINLKILRPATVCGYSPKMRLDLSVNMLSMQALSNKEITLFGGSQIRPNLNINDMVSAYLHMIKDNSKNIIYNVGNENLSLREMSLLIQKIIPCKIKVLKISDVRSYRLDSSKLLKTGFRFRYSVEDAVKELKYKHSIGLLKNNSKFYNLVSMNKKIHKIKKDL